MGEEVAKVAVELGENLVVGPHGDALLGAEHVEVGPNVALGEVGQPRIAGEGGAIGQQVVEEVGQGTVVGVDGQWGQLLLVAEELLKTFLVGIVHWAAHSFLSSTNLL